MGNTGTEGFWGIGNKLYGAILWFLSVVLFKIAKQVSSYSSCLGESCKVVFAVKLQKCFMDLYNFTQISIGSGGE